MNLVAFGFGWAFQNLWLPFVSDLPDPVICHVIDPHKTNEIEQFNAKYPLGDMHRLRVIDHIPEGMDVCVIASPNHLHREHAVSAITADIPVVILEKPVTMTQPELDALLQLADARGCELHVSCPTHYRTDLSRFFETLAGNGIGPVRELQVRWLRRAGVPSGGGWFCDRGAAKGGAFQDLGWHLLDSMAHYFDPGSLRLLHGFSWSAPEKFARGVAKWRQQQDSMILEANVEDSAMALLALGKVPVIVQVGWDEDTDFDITEYRARGDEGTLILKTLLGFSPQRLPDSTIHLRRGGKQDIILRQPNTIGLEYRAMVRDLLSRRPDFTNNQDRWKRLSLVRNVVEDFYARG